MRLTQRFAAIGMAATLSAGILFTPIQARASEEGKRNTTLALGAAALGLLLTQKNKLPGILAGAGAVYAYTQYQKDIDNRHKREAAWRDHARRRQHGSYQPRPTYRRAYDSRRPVYANYTPSPRFHKTDRYRDYRRHDRNDYQNRRNRRRDGNDNRYHHYDNGKHNGWYKDNHRAWDKHHDRNRD